MISEGARFRLTAVASALLGALLLLSSWDGLYDALELPQAQPALAPQIGGLAVLGLAFLLWSAASAPELHRPVAIAAVLLYLGSAVLIAAWLIFRENADLGIGDAGAAILVVVAVVFAVLGAALIRARRS